MSKLVRCLDEDVESSAGGDCPSRGPFGPDRMCDTVAKTYCSVASTVASAQYFPVSPISVFPVSPISETELEADQVK